MAPKRKQCATARVELPVVPFKKRDTATTRLARLTRSATTDKDAIQLHRQCANVTAPWSDVLKGDLVLLIGLDFGTATSAVTAAVVPRTSTAIDPTQISLLPIELDGEQELLLTQIAILPDQHNTKNARVIFGSAVDDELRNGSISPQHVFRNLKQSKCFVQPDSTSMAPALRQSMQTLQHAHDETLKLWRTYSKIYLRHSSLPDRGNVKPQSMEDIVGLFLAHLVMETKRVLHKKSNLPYDVLSDLFEGKLDSPSRPKVRFGIAVPELWKSQRLQVYNLVREKAFVSPYLEVLSESKCAAAMMLVDKLNRLPGNASSAREKMVREMSEMYFMNVDIGGHTLDISTMRMHLEGSVVKLRTIGDSTSTEDGAERANEVFRSRLTDFLGPQRIHEIAQTFNAGNAWDVEEGFVRGFEHCKKRFDPSQSTRQMVNLTYQGARDLPAGRHTTVSWAGRVVKIPHKQFLNCLRDPAKQMLKTDGPTLTHLRAIQELAGDRKIEVLFSGGGSRSAVLRQEIERKVEFAKYTWTEVGLVAESLVSKGAVLTLADPEICRDVKTSHKSYGVRIAVDYDPDNLVHRTRRTECVPSRDFKGGVMELPDTAVWRHKFTDLCRTEPKMNDYMLTVMELGQDPSTDTSNLVLEVEIVQSSHPAKGTIDGYAVDDKDITAATVLKVPISRRMAISLGAKDSEASDQIVSRGFSLGDDDVWRLYFHYRVVFSWCNILQFWEVQIARGGSFDKPDKTDEVSIFRFTLTGDCVLAADNES